MNHIHRRDTTLAVVRDRTVQAAAAQDLAGQDRIVPNAQPIPDLGLGQLDLADYVPGIRDGQFRIVRYSLIQKSDHQRGLIKGIAAAVHPGHGRALGITPTAFPFDVVMHELVHGCGIVPECAGQLLYLVRDRRLVGSGSTAQATAKGRRCGRLIQHGRPIGRQLGLGQSSPGCKQARGH